YDVTIRDVELGVVDLSLIDLDRTLILMDELHLAVHDLLRDRIFLGKRLVTHEIGLRLLQQRLILDLLALRLLERELVWTRIDDREQIALLDRLSFLERDLGDLAA